MKSKEEQKKIIYKFGVIVLLALISGLLFMSIENMVLSIICNIVGIICIIKLNKTMKNIHKNLQEFYPNEFYNIKEPTHFEITSYLKANGFTLISKVDMIFAVKYYKTNNKIFTNHNMLSMLFLQKEDKHFLAEEYGDEIKEFTKKLMKDLNLKIKVLLQLM